MSLSPSQVIVLATPVFLLLIAAEYAYGRAKGRNTYRLNDAVNSISLGMLSEVTKVLTLLLRVGIYTAVYHAAAMGPGPEFWTSWYGWLLALVFYDFCYYWLHRGGHEVAVLWAAHVVHHQSEDYNLSTALRQTSTGFLLSWIFYLPMAVAGVPPLVFVTVAALNLLYQFWVHTRHVPKLGWYEWFFVTPSNHRVHHAQNPVYMDRNYGGVFILWDRLFGTFQEELDEQPVVFGVTTPLRSWNPLWANLQFYVQLWRDAVRAGSWWDRLRIWFMPTGWRPVDVAARYPLDKPDLASFRKFEVPLARGQKVYAALQFTSYVLGTSWLLAVAAQHGLGVLVGAWLWVAFGLYAIGIWLENRPFARGLELLRLALNLPALLWAQQVGLVGEGMLVWGLLVAWSLASLTWLLWSRQAQTQPA